MKITQNIFYNLLEKAFTTVASFFQIFIYARFLGDSNYGVIGAIVGYSTFIAIINIAAEAKLMSSNIANSKLQAESTLKPYYTFFYIKSMAYVVFLLPLMLLMEFENISKIEYLAALLSHFCVFLLDAWIAPLSIYASAKYKHSIITVFSLLRSLLNITLLIAIYLNGSLIAVFIKDFVLLLFGVFIFSKLINKYVTKINFISLMRPSFFSLKRSFIIIKNFSVFVHLNSVCTNVIYKSDLFFLSVFVSTEIVGKYNYAIGIANTVNIVLMVIGFQNTLAVSNNNNQQVKINKNFLKLSISAGILMLLGFYCFGEFLIKILIGDDPQNTIFNLALYIVIGLTVVKSFASPFASFLLAKGFIKDLLYYVAFPAVIFTIIIYYFFASNYGAIEVAKSNIIVSLFWLFLILIQAYRCGYFYGFSKN